MPKLWKFFSKPDVNESDTSSINEKSNEKSEKSEKSEKNNEKSTEKGKEKNNEKGKDKNKDRNNEKGKDKNNEKGKDKNNERGKDKNKEKGDKGKDKKDKGKDKRNTIKSYSDNDLSPGELKNKNGKRKKSLTPSEGDISRENPLNSEVSSSLVQNRLVLQEFIDLQKGIVNDVIYIADDIPKEVIMKVDLLGVHVFDKENPKTLIKEFEVEQIIQYSYERDKQYLTLSYMNSDYAVESYDFVTPDYFEIFDFIGHVIAMVIKMNNQKYEPEDELAEANEVSYQLPSISTMYKSTDNTNIFSPTFILNNFMPENTASPVYLSGRDDQYMFNNNNNDMFHEVFTEEKDIKNKKRKGKKDLSMEGGEFSNSTPNISINTRAKSYLIAGPQSAIENKGQLSDSSSKMFVFGKKGECSSLDNLDKRSSYQCRTLRHGNNGRHDNGEIPAYGKKYGTIHFRKSHDVDEAYNSDFVLNSNTTDLLGDDKSYEGISNQTQQKVNIMKYFVESRYNVDKRKAYSYGALFDDDDKQDQLRKSDSEEDSNIDSSKETLETNKEDDRRKFKKHLLRISRTNINKACGEESPTVADIIDDSESTTKKGSSKKLKLKYNFSRPKSLQLNFLTYKDSNKKRISVKNPVDINDIYAPSPMDGEAGSDNTTEKLEKVSKAQKRKSYLKKSKKLFHSSSSKKLANANDNENESESIKNDTESVGTTSDIDLDNKKEKNNSNVIQYYNPITDEIEEKPIDDLRNSIYGIPTNTNEAPENQGKNETELLSAYLEAYSSTPGSKVYSSAVSTIKSTHDTRISKSYPKEFINSLSENPPPPNESNNYDYYGGSMKESSSFPPLDDEESPVIHTGKLKKSKSSFDSKSENIEGRYFTSLKSKSSSCKSDELVNLDLGIIKEQYKDTLSRSSNYVNDGVDDKESINEGGNQQQLHKYKNKQVMNYRSIHGVSPFVAQGNSNTMIQSNIQPTSDRTSTRGRQSHTDIYSTFRKFVSKNQKTKINEISFTDGAPDNDEKLPQIEKEYEDGKEYLIRTLKDNHYEVTAGTVHALINEMIVNNTTDIMFIDIFLLTYRHFLKANDFVLLLTEEFNKLVDKIDENEDNTDVLLQIQKVASVIKKWLGEYFNDFIMSSEALDNLNALIETMKNSEKAQCQSYVDQLNSLIKYGLKESEEEKPEEIEIPDKNKNLTYEVDLLDVLSISSKKIAQQLTLVDSKLWRSIESQEYAHFLWDSKDIKEKNTRNIQKFIERFNQISFWVSTMICKTQSLKNRTSILEKMIKVAKYCLEIQNFNSTMAILSGLNMAAVSRLKGTWMTLSTKTMSIYNEIEEAMSYKSNYKNYRDLEYNAKPPLIPFFGLMLKDLTFMNDGNQKILKNELINFQKCRLIYSKIKSVNLIQKDLYGFQPDNTIIETIKLSPTESNSENIVKHEIEIYEYFKILPHYTEMTLLELSRKIETTSSKAYNTIMIPKAQANLKPISDNEKSNTAKNPSLIELFQQ